MQTAIDTLKTQLASIELEIPARVHLRFWATSVAFAIWMRLPWVA